MANDVLTRPTEGQAVTPSGAESSPPSRSGRRLKFVLIGVGVLAGLIIVAVAVLLLGRESAEQVDQAQVLKEFRTTNGQSAGESADAAGLPAQGVYMASAEGMESIGLPGFDEALGPKSPVTVTHQDGGCFNYRVGFNSHHWRSWTFCPSTSAEFALTKSDGWTARKAPGLDIEALNTYACDTPLNFFWKGMKAGETSVGSCTGTSDMDDSVTADALRLEVIGRESVEVDGVKVDTVHVRTTETFSQDQTGSEVDDWWLNAKTGLPIRITIDSKVSGGASNYTETGDLRLTTLTPAT